MLSLTCDPWDSGWYKAPRHNSFVLSLTCDPWNSGAIEETRIFIIIVIIFLPQVQREFQRAILQSKASNPPMSA